MLGLVATGPWVAFLEQCSGSQVGGSKDSKDSRFTALNAEFSPWLSSLLKLDLPIAHYTVKVNLCAPSVLFSLHLEKRVLCERKESSSEDLSKTLNKG